MPMPMILAIAAGLLVTFGTVYVLFFYRRHDLRPATMAFGEFRSMLFATQPLDELVVDEEPKTRAFQPQTWKMLRQAQVLIDQEKGEQAIELLEKILLVPRLETRIQLWTWNALRSLDRHPPEDVAMAVQGVIFEIPVEDGLDTLAIYVDGNVRYVDHMGKVVIWDRGVDEVAALSMGLIGLVSPLNSTLVLTDQNPMPTSDRIYVTTLSFTGTRYGGARLEELKNKRHQFAPMFAAAMEMMRVLRSSSNRQKAVATRKSAQKV